MSGQHAHAAADPHAKNQAHAPHSGGGHGGHRGHKGGHEEHKHHGPPPWLISFGDMMTLFLCFFIILLTMAPTQDAGLVARGLGPFVVALENKGMDLPLTGAQCLDAVNAFRRRFGLEEITEQELLEGRVDAKNVDEVAKLLQSALRAYTSLPQPVIARFERGSPALTTASARYLDLIAESLRPGHGQTLVLEGHADDGEEPGDRAAGLALARARAVRDHLIDTHQFIPQRLEARAFALEPDLPGRDLPAVDARLLQPIAQLN